MEKNYILFSNYFYCTIFLQIVNRILPVPLPILFCTWPYCNTTLFILSQLPFSPTTIIICHAIRAINTFFKYAFPSTLFPIPFFFLAFLNTILKWMLLLLLLLFFLKRWKFSSPAMKHVKWLMFYSMLA